MLLEESPYIVGQAKAIFFQNPSNFYKVILIEVSETNTDYREKEIVVTGSFGQIQEEETYRFFGEFMDHPRYGRQFQVERYEQEKPTSAQGLVMYLSSDKFPGIGKKTAEKIVETLGEGVIDEIIEDPSKLAEVPGLNQKKREMILDTLRANHGMEQVVAGLNRYGFGSRLAFSIYQTYKNEAMTIIQENPYQLVEDIEGIGFKRGDQLAEQLGIAADSPQRIRAAILHEIFQSSVQTGNTYIEAQQLLVRVIELLESSRPVEITPDQAANVILELVEEGKVQQEGTKLYENSLYFSEWGIASSIQRLLKRKKEIKYAQSEVDKRLRSIEKAMDISYGSSQENAIKEAITSPLFILTGGPGTGKTTVINGIVQLFAKLNDLELDPAKYTQKIFPILLAAPTGRAAKRMNETTGLPASTIHRLLGLNGRERVPTTDLKELEGGLLIVDEMSMVDTWLANTLFKAIPTNMQVILVGDKDQLPSVGPGQVFHDLLQISDIPKMELTEIYRQGDGSSIIPLAHEIKEGRLPVDFTKNKPDRSFIPCHANQMESVIGQIVQKAKAKGFTSQNVQVLAPMYRGPAGIDAINKMMQEIFNPNDGTKKEFAWNDTVYRIGDKVLQLVNAPELNVFNGDMGQIVGMIPAKESESKVDELVIQFDANEITYPKGEWNKITLSYCCSIHKSQGSEFQMVILPMVSQYRRMLQRNLLYTAVTRSKDLLILLGEQSAFQECVSNESVDRLTTLVSRISESENMSIADHQRLEAYEESVLAADPFEEVQSDPVVKPKKQAESMPLFETEDIIEEEVSTFPEESILTLRLIQENQIDPMIGMKGITPEQFMH